MQNILSRMWVRKKIKTSRFFLLTIILFCMPTENHADQVLQLSKHHDQHDIAKYIKYLEDETGRLSLQEAVRAKGWHKNGDDVLNFGVTRSAFWLRLAIEPISSGKNRYIEFEFPSIDHIEAFFFSGSKIIATKKTGALYPISSRDFNHRNFVFKLPASTDQIYFRLKSRLSLIAHGNLLSGKGWLEKNSRDHLVFGIFFGILATMILYHLVIFFTLFDNNYLYYALFLFSYLMFTTSEFGLISQYLFPEHPALADDASIFFMIFSWLFIFLFARAYLQIKSFSRLMDNMILFCAWFSAAFFNEFP